MQNNHSVTKILVELQDNSNACEHLKNALSMAFVFGDWGLCGLEAVLCNKVVKLGK